MKILLDKIASVTKNANLPEKVTVIEKLVVEEGALLVVEALKNKTIYNQLELVSGRLSTIQKGDILAVALGNRRALKGFVGDLPERLKVGDTIHLLNMGGVAGICTSQNVKEVGYALKVKVIGAIAKGKKPLNIKQFSLFKGKKRMESTVPLILISGTCMDVGKTSVACEILQKGRRKGLHLFAAKLTGVAALKDVEKMKDYGAHKSISFVDGGYTSTAKHKGEIVSITKGAIDYLSQSKPDAIVIEFGDGLLGEYGVEEILKNADLQNNMAFHIGCAYDPLGAMKIISLC